MNTFMNNLTNSANYKRTENGALAHYTTTNMVYDLFGMGAAYRTRSEEDCILLFKNAYEQNKTLALKCLFYIRDVRGGQGERRFFRVCMKWLAENDHRVVENLVALIPEFGRWDDLMIFIGTPVEKTAMQVIKNQLTIDMASYMHSSKEGVSLLAKWLPSENASSTTTVANAKAVRKFLNMTSRQYRKTLSALRERINVLERLMSANRWDEIEFSKIPSKAGMIYRNAFARNDVIGERYKAFMSNKNTKVNAETLYPYEIVSKVSNRVNYYYGGVTLDQTERDAINKYWENQKDYLNGEPCSMMCVVDTSSSMTGYSANAPINVAISLGMYCAERVGGPFKNHYISFSRTPRLIKIEGTDFCNKVARIYRTNLCENTDLIAVFDLLLNIARKPSTRREDIPKTIVVISDMEIDNGTRSSYLRNDGFNPKTDMEKMRQKWASYGLTLPRLVYWNVQARQNTVLDSGPDVTLVSGCSPVIFQQVLTGKTGIDLMLEKLNSERYAAIHA